MFYQNNAFNICEYEKKSSGIPFFIVFFSIYTVSSSPIQGESYPHFLYIAGKVGFAGVSYEIWLDFSVT